MKKRMTWILAVVMVVSFCLPAFAQTYTVQKGDTLSRLAKRCYGDYNAWVMLWEVNRDVLKDADSLEIGQNIELPNLTGSQVTEDPEYEVSAENEVLTVRLKGNSTTGYEWNFAISEGDVVEELTSQYVADDAPAGMAGVGGTFVASFKPTFRNDGTAVITFNYARSWEPQPIETRTFTVTVAGGKITSVVKQ